MTPQQGSLLLLVALVSLVGLNPVLAAETRERQAPSRRDSTIASPRLALPELIAEVQRVNPDIQAARARVQAANARIPQAGALPDPMVICRIHQRGLPPLDPR